MAKITLELKFEITAQFKKEPTLEEDESPMDRFDMHLHNACPLEELASATVIGPGAGNCAVIIRCCDIRDSGNNKLFKDDEGQFKVFDPKGNKAEATVAFKLTEGFHTILLQAKTGHYHKEIAGSDPKVKYIVHLNHVCTFKLLINDKIEVLNETIAGCGSKTDQNGTLTTTREWKLDIHAPSYGLTISRPAANEPVFCTQQGVGWVKCAGYANGPMQPAQTVYGRVYRVQSDVPPATPPVGTKSTTPNFNGYYDFGTPSAGNFTGISDADGPCTINPVDYINKAAVWAYYMQMATSWWEQTDVVFTGT